MPALIAVACGVLLSDGRIFACRRPAAKAFGGSWEFPGGKLEPGESPEAALHRELAEELQVGIHIAEALTPVDYPLPDTTLRLHPFLVEIRSGNLNPTEHPEVGWFLPDAARLLQWAPPDLPILEEVFLRLRA